MSDQPILPAPPVPPPARVSGRKARNAPFTAEFWGRLRAAYILGGRSARDVADEFAVDATTVRRRAAAEGWHAERKRLSAGKGQLIAGRFGADAPPSAAQLLGQPGDPRGTEANDAALQRHARITDRYLAIVEAAMEELLQMVPGRPKAEAVRHCGEALARAITLSREVRGIRPGEASAEDTQERSTLRVVVSPEPVLAKASSA